MKDIIIKKFAEVFGDAEGAEAFFAPGRVNLIGEHTDYNGGHVFPCALTIGTYAVARKREDNKLRFYSMNFERLGIIESSLDNLEPDKEAGWTNYPKGVIWAFGEKGYKINCGFDILLNGNIPNGSGLSSSASVEVVTGYILSEMLGLGVSNQELALIGQFSENNFNGVNCGIMDQFAIAMGKKDNAIFLDTSDLSLNMHQLNLMGLRLLFHAVIKSVGLGTPSIMKDVQNVKKLLKQYSLEWGLIHFGDLDEEQFEQVKSVIKDEDQRKRAKHAVYENQRTIKAVSALKNNDIELFGNYNFITVYLHCSNKRNTI